MFSGESGAGERSIVLLNAGAALYVAGAASSIERGMEKALESIDSGKAKRKMSEFIRCSAAGGDVSG